MVGDQLESTLGEGTEEAHIRTFLIADVRGYTVLTVGLLVDRGRSGTLLRLLTIIRRRVFAVDSRSSHRHFVGDHGNRITPSFVPNFR
jgi:hypothetical protein